MILNIIREHIPNKPLIINKIKRDSNGKIIHKRNGKFIGVYWLILGNEIVYIGYSKNLISRLKSHSNSKSKNWDSARCVVIDDSSLSKSIEFALLVNVPTKYNSDRAIKRSENLPQLYSSHSCKINSILMYLNKDKTPIFYEKYYKKLIELKNMSFEDFVMNYELRMSGKPNKLAYTIPNYF